MTTPRPDTAVFTATGRGLEAEQAGWLSPRHWALAGVVVIALALPLLFQGKRSVRGACR